jgi:hypothetical protein
MSETLKSHVPTIAQNRETLATLEAVYQQAWESFQKETMALRADIEAAKGVCAEDEAFFRDAALREYEATGVKKMLDGLVTIRENKTVASYDKQVVETWVREFHPGWMVPDFKRVEKAAKAGDETPLTVELVPSVAVNMDKVAALVSSESEE